MSTITIHCRDGRVFSGRSVETIIRREFGYRAFYRPSQSPNSPEVGAVLQRTDTFREYRVLAEIIRIEPGTLRIEKEGVSLTDIIPGRARVMLNGREIGHVERREHVGQILHDDTQRPGENTAEIVTVMMWGFTPHGRDQATELNDGPRHIGEGFSTRREAVDALLSYDGGKSL